MSADKNAQKEGNTEPILGDKTTPPPVNQEELKRLISASMNTARTLPPRDYGKFFDNAGQNEPELVPEPPPKPEPPKKGDLSDPNAGKKSDRKKKQSIKRQSMKKHSIVKH